MAPWVSYRWLVKASKIGGFWLLLSVIPKRFRGIRLRRNIAIVGGGLDKVSGLTAH